MWPVITEVIADIAFFCDVIVRLKIGKTLYHVIGVETVLIPDIDLRLDPDVVLIA